MTRDRTQRLRNRAGYSAVELLTAVSIFGILAAAGLPHVDTGRQNLQSATTQIVSDFRWTRVRAITSGTHFAIKWTDINAYEIERMKQDAEGNWNVDEVIKQVSLPGAVMRWGYPERIEFNTRGMMVSTEYAAWQSLWDMGFGTGRMVTTWPSGQTYDG